MGDSLRRDGCLADVAQTGDHEAGHAACGRHHARHGLSQFDGLAITSDKAPTFSDIINSEIWAVLSAGLEGRHPGTSRNFSKHPA